MKPFSLRNYFPAAGIFALALIEPACTGTETDNPFTDRTPTSLCKGDDEYVPLSNHRESLALNEHWADGELRAAPAPPSPSTLSPLSEVPIWLECLEWDLTEGNFDYQIANFSGGCAIDWEGGGNVTKEGHVTIELKNNNCSVAGCGSCLYDLRSSGNLKISQTVETVSLDLLRKNCDDEITRKSNWNLPVAAQQHGRLCREADMWGAMSGDSNSTSSVNELYAPCDDGSAEEFAGRECAEDFSCIAGRCLPACTIDDECPLGGALICRDNFCQLPESAETMQK